MIYIELNQLLKIIIIIVPTRITLNLIIFLCLINFLFQILIVKFKNSVRTFDFIKVAHILAYTPIRS